LASGKADAKKRGPQVQSKESAWVGFKPDAAAGSNRNATTSACVGWDKLNIEKRFAFRKQRKSHTCPTSSFI